jgi:hypothetical protein
MQWREGRWMCLHASIRHAISLLFIC